MRDLEKYLRCHRLKARYCLTVEIGEKLLALYTDSPVIREELSIAYYWIETETVQRRLANIRRAICLTNEIIDLRPKDQEFVKRARFNHKMFIKEIESLLANIAKMPLATNKRALQRPVTVVLSSLPCVTFTITTCRRLNEFIQTMDAFLENFQDIHLIHRWICVDDNSDAQDRELMKTKYPFFEFVWKGPEAQGHPISMKILSGMVSTPFMLHIEDDRMLVDKRHYLRDMIDILDSDKSLGQVVFNEHYSETAEDDIKGGEEKTTDNGVFYIEHVYCSTDEEKVDFFSKHGNVTNCCYYPHFSLSPSLIRTQIFDKIAFEKETSFEFKFALRYVQAGYKTAFLYGHHFKHIGRLTSDKHTTKLNAYDLLNTAQFTEPVKYKSFIINLDRRPDRLEKVMSKSVLLPKGLTRLRAYDGIDLIRTPELYSLCKKCDYGMRPGVIGCALSHLRLYKNLLSDPDVEGYLIFEDDITPNTAFIPKISRIFTLLQNKGTGFDLVFFSTILRSPNKVDKDPKLVSEQTEEVVRKHNRQEIDAFTIGGTGCYYISKHAARVVFGYIAKNTLDVAIDAVLFNIANQTNTYFVLPPIISQTNNIACTDVQHDHYITSPLMDKESLQNAKELCDEAVSNLFDNLKFRTIQIKNNNQNNNQSTSDNPTEDKTKLSKIFNQQITMSMVSASDY